MELPITTGSCRHRARRVSAAHKLILLHLANGRVTWTSKRPPYISHDLRLDALDVTVLKKLILLNLTEWTVGLD